MPAVKLSEAVSESECQVRLEKQDDINRNILAQLQTINTSINGEPGNTRKPGIGGALIKLSDRLEQQGRMINETQQAVKRIESQNTASHLTKLEIQLESANQKIEDVRVEAKYFPWVKVVVAMLGICTAALGVAGGVVVLLTKVL